MRLPFRLGRREYAIEEAGDEHAMALAELHEEGFSRPWSPAEFEALVAQDAVTGFVAREIGRPGEPAAGFVLLRRAGEEAEVLTIAVSRAHRGRGVGWALMDAALRHLHGERVSEIFLEVDEGNAAALALYRRLGFSAVGSRPAYYREPGQAATGALVMRRDLRRPAAAEAPPS